jgi:hypothetical protein
MNSLTAFIELTDPETIAAVSEVPEGADRDNFIVSCVRIGVLALRQARGVVDEQAVRHAGDRLIDQIGGTLSKYFDSDNGLFEHRISALTSDSGELSNLMRAQIAEAQRQYDSMPPALRDVMQASSTAIAAQFSLDDPASALSRLVRDLAASHGTLTGDLGNRMTEMLSEFSLDKPDSALSRLVGRVEDAQRGITSQFSLDDPLSALSRMSTGIDGKLEAVAQAQREFQIEVHGLLSGLAAKKEAEARSTTHGFVFEEKVGNVLRSFVEPAGDILEACGNTTGIVRASKVGDFVLTLGSDSAAAGAQIVVEAKESGSYTIAGTIAEGDEACRNRAADICLFVHSVITSPMRDVLRKYGNTVVVCWDAERDDLPLRAGYLVAKALSVRAAVKSGNEAESFAVIDKAIEVVRKQIEGFSEINTSAETISSGAGKILNRARIMRGELEKQIEALAEALVAVRT